VGVPQNLRYAVRSLLGHPGYLATTLATLTLAIGFNTATFTVINAVLLRPLPYQDPGRLVRLRERRLPQFPEFSISPGNYLAWRDRTRSFTAIGAWGSSGAALDTGSGDVERVVAQRVTANLFPMLGASPILGRGFTEDDDRAGAPAITLLSYGAWQRRFGGGSVLGREIRLSGQPVTIVGVMPSGFAFPSATTELWFPMAFTPDERQRFGSHYLSAIGRLKPGVTIDAARVDLNNVAGQLAAEHPDSDRGWDVLAFSLKDYQVRDVKPALLVLIGAVGFVLLIACANVANLLLARGAARSRELAIRTALGASRSRIVGQLLIENGLISCASAALGVALAAGMLRALLALLPGALPGQDSISLDAPVLLFALGLAIVTPLLFGLLPARFAARADVRELLAAGGRQGGASPARRTRTVLVITEMAMAMMLLVGAVLLIRSFAHLSAVSPGFNADRVVLGGVGIPESKYAAGDQRTQFFAALLDRVRRLPGVEAAGLTESVPLVNDFVSALEIEGHPIENPVERPSANFYAVNHDYFQAMGIPLIQGRALADTDTASGPNVSVINQEMARKYFPNENPIGRRIRVSQGRGEWSQIVGIAGDVKQYGLDEHTRAQVYQPYQQHQYFSSFTLVVKSRGADAASVVPDVRAAVRGLDPGVPLARVTTLESIVSDSIGSQRFAAVLIGLFGGAALLLAAVGLYGVLAYTVGQRTQEFAIRIAHGADRGDVLRLVLLDGLKTSSIGTAAGVAGAIVARRVLAGLLFGITAGDPITYVAVAVMLLAVALVATAIPALRATRVDPIVALRA
jgi:putative ABC transport system permease protein